MSLFELSLRFHKLAASEKPANNTMADERFQAYEFMAFMGVLAHLKNQLSKIREMNAIFNMVFNELVKLRPGTLKNAISEMIQTNTFDRTIYVDLRNAALRDITNAGLVDRLKDLVSIVEVELLDHPELVKSEEGQSMQLAKKYADKAIQVMSAGLQYQ